MGRLKRFLKGTISASSITEVIVATTILLTVFGIAMITLSNIMTNSVRKDTSRMEIKLEKLLYKYRNNQLKVPSTYSEDSFIINVQKLSEKNISFIEFTITNSVTKKSITKKQLFYEEVR